MIGKNSKPALKRTLYSVILNRNDLVLMCNPYEPVVIKNISPFQRKLLLLLDGNLTVKQIVDKLKKEKLKCEIVDVLNEINLLNDKFLIEEGSLQEKCRVRKKDKFYERYDRSRMWFAAKKMDGMNYAREVEKKLKDAHVAVFGLGGLGTHIFQQLAMTGIGKLTAVDHDKVEYSNLNRQILFCETDVDHPKIKVLKERAKSINSSTKYNFIQKKISSTDDFTKIIRYADIAVLCADTPRDEIFKWMNEASFKIGTPVLYSTGILHETMGIGPLVIPGKTSCYLCSMPEDANFKDPLVEFINRRHCHGIIVPTLSVCAGIMVYELLKHLVGGSCRLYDKMLHFDLRTYSIYFQEIRKRKNCPCN